MLKSTNSINKAIIIITLIFSVNPLFAQVEKGDIAIDADYGLLGFRKGIIYTFIENADASEFDIDGKLETSYLGPVGIRGEYMINEKVGLGLETNYTSRNASWTDKSYTGTNNETEVSVTYTLSQTIVRAMFRINYVFKNEEKYQLYFANSFGYRYVHWELQPFNNYTEILSLSTYPVAYRMAMGGRYWFTPNVGVHGEIGASGGSYISAGLSGKF